MEKKKTPPKKKGGGKKEEKKSKKLLPLPEISAEYEKESELFFFFFFFFFFPSPLLLRLFEVGQYVLINVVPCDSIDFNMETCRHNVIIKSHKSALKKRNRKRRNQKRKGKKKKKKKVTSEIRNYQLSVAQGGEESQVARRLLANRSPTVLTTVVDPNGVIALTNIKGSYVDIPYFYSQLLLSYFLCFLFCFFCFSFFFFLLFLRTVADGQFQ